MSEISTKERIIEAAEELMLAKSFHAVGLNEILTAVNVPKGSFYHLFKSKEDFGVELIKHYIAKCENKTVMDLDSVSEEHPLDLLFASMEEGIHEFIEHDFKCPCLIMKLTSEVSSFSEPMRVAVADGFMQWVSHYSKFFEKAVQLGLLPAETDIGNEAQFMVDLWYGACHRAIATQSASPLWSALTHLKNHCVKGNS